MDAIHFADFLVNRALNWQLLEPAGPHFFRFFFYIRSIEQGPFEEIKLLLDKKVFDVLLWLIALQFIGNIAF